VKRTLKKPSPLSEKLTDEKTKGDTVHIYLRAPQLQVLDRLSQVTGKSPNKIFQDLLDQYALWAPKVAEAGINSIPRDDKSEAAEALREALRKLGLG
jgi:Holliday junction resolvasome RuvABC DNA-binding subunit